MGLAHRRLRILSARLAAHGAEPLYSDEAIEALDDAQASCAAAAEGDRLTLLANLEQERLRRRRGAAWHPSERPDPEVSA